MGTGLPESIIGFDIRGLKKRDTGLVYRNEIIAYIRDKGRVGESTGAKKDGRVRLAQIGYCMSRCYPAWW